MKYKNIIKATFIKRPNRFIAHCEVNGQVEVVHVKNTGKCKELLIEGVTVYLEESDNPNRKTKYSLIAVEKGNRLINMDSQVPNKVAYEALVNKKIHLPYGEEIKEIKMEKTYKKSRFDVYIETETKKIFMEVKGVTLEEDNVVLFPDAKTERGVKHVYELCEAQAEGYECYLLFVIQMKGVTYFMPNRKMHPEFADALIYAKEKGVQILAYDCMVMPDELEIRNEVEVRL
ncbi:MAG: DNA/RNA nuclease SfsA [Bacillaceae bacterium]